MYIVHLLLDSNNNNNISTRAKFFVFLIVYGLKMSFLLVFVCAAVTARGDFEPDALQNKTKKFKRPSLQKNAF